MNGRELSIYSDEKNNISFKYDADGIRNSKIVNGVETKYYLEGKMIIFEDRNGDVIYYIYNGGELLGFIYKNKTYYQHKNIFEDIIGILDSNYNEIVKYSYDSFGALINIIDNGSINLGKINPFRYRSYYYYIETQLYYLNSRYYNPRTGRFLNFDTGISDVSAGAVVVTNKVKTGSWKGTGAAAIKGASIGAFAGAVIGAAVGGAKTYSKISTMANKYWATGNGGQNPMSQLKYHYKKHVIAEGCTKGNNVFKYTDDALDFMSKNSTELKYTYNYGYNNTSWNQAYIRGAGAEFTGEGKIITFWYIPKSQFKIM